MALSTYRQLASWIDTLRKSLIDFEQLLEDENASLHHAATADSLFDLIERKQNQAQTLDSYLATLSQCPLIRIRQRDIEFVLDSSQDREEEELRSSIQSGWHSVLRLLHQCQKVNSDNGALTQCLLHTTRSSLLHLQTVTGMPGSQIYDKNGSTNYDIKAHSGLIKA